MLALRLLLQMLNLPLQKLLLRLLPAHCCCVCCLRSAQLKLSKVPLVLPLLFLFARHSPSNYLLTKKAEELLYLRSTNTASHSGPTLHRTQQVGAAAAAAAAAVAAETTGANKCK